MKKRLFIAINIPEDLKDKIAQKLEDIRCEFTNDIRFIEREDWHLTATFLGYQSDEAIGAILASMKGVSRNRGPIKIQFSDVSYGPKGKTPRMIWLNGSSETAKNLTALKEDLENNLADKGVIFKREHRQIRPHITLARFNFTDRLPAIDSRLSLEFRVESLDLMESFLSSGGAKYEILQKVKFEK